MPKYLTPLTFQHLYCIDRKGAKFMGKFRRQLDGGGLDDGDYFLIALGGGLFWIWNWVRVRNFFEFLTGILSSLPSAQNVSEHAMAPGMGGDTFFKIKRGVETFFENQKWGAETFLNIQNGAARTISAKFWALLYSQVPNKRGGANRGYSIFKI